jgi:hypothetical protein
MSTYEQIDQLTNNVAFQGRVRACCTQEAGTFAADTRPPISELAKEVLRSGGPVFNFVRIIAAFPGILPAEPLSAQPRSDNDEAGDEAGAGGGDEVGEDDVNGGGGGNGGGPLDQTLIPDAAILAQVQAQWPTVADLFWDEEGNRFPS